MCKCKCRLIRLYIHIICYICACVIEYLLFPLTQHVFFHQPFISHPRTTRVPVHLGG